MQCNNEQKRHSMNVRGTKYLLDFGLFENKKTCSYLTKFVEIVVMSFKLFFYLKSKKCSNRAFVPFQFIQYKLQIKYVYLTLLIYLLKILLIEK
jgi:hypothetical protein